MSKHILEFAKNSISLPGTRAVLVRVLLHRLAKKRGFRLAEANESMSIYMHESKRLVLTVWENGGFELKGLDLNKDYYYRMNPIIPMEGMDFTKCDRDHAVILGITDSITPSKHIVARLEFSWGSPASRGSVFIRGYRDLKKQLKKGIKRLDEGYASKLFWGN